MTVSLDGRKRVINDIMIGDVYILAGQSNMQFKLHDSDFPKERYQSNEYIRLFSLERMEGGESGERYWPEDGWVRCEKTDAGDWPCIGYIAAMRSFQNDHRAIGLITCYQGAAAIQSFLPERVYDDGLLPEIDYSQRYDRDYLWNMGHSLLYRYMFCRIVPYQCRAVIWYQGESNCSKEESGIYADMLDLLIKTWREDMSDPGLKFIIIQIADYIPRMGACWSQIQQAQAVEAEKEDNVLCVISRDVCENDRIHPVSKTILSYRVASAM